MAEDLDSHYPQSCPFCAIGNAYPAVSPSPSVTTSRARMDNHAAHQDKSKESQEANLEMIQEDSFPLPPPPITISSTPALAQYIPADFMDEDSISPTRADATVSSENLDPAAHVLLAAPRALAFLDIMPMTRGHVLVASRAHRRTVGELEVEEASEIGFWLPLVARAVSHATGVTDYNIVQNNGARAAQVVPHVHFHIIPRPADMPAIESRSWRMFGRGQRLDLDEEDARQLVQRMKECLREEVERRFRTAPHGSKDRSARAKM